MVGNSGGGGSVNVDERKMESWSNLPCDLILSILSLLCYTDQIRFRAVCKNWREANVQGVESADKLPWMIAIDSHLCYLYDPFNKRKYTIKSNITMTGIFKGSKILALKFGWVLFNRREGDSDSDSNNNNSNSVLFFYNPFIDKIIHLPRPKSDFYNFSAATFTRSPVSSDCEIFAINKEGNRFYINVCRQEDRKWKWYEFSFHGDDCGPSSRVEYVNGILYALFPTAKPRLGLAIGAFNAAIKEWKMLPYPWKEDELIISDGLIEFNGNLFIAQDVLEGFQCYSWSQRQWRVYMLDQDVMKWFQVKSLDNTSLFLDTTSFFIPAVHDAIALANSIHSRLGYKRPQIEQIYDWDASGLSKLWIQHPPLKN